MYSASGLRAIAATQSSLAVTGGTGLVTRIQKILLSSSGTPTSDQSINTQIRRQTAVGTGTSVTPGVKQPGQFPAAETTALSNLTVEPTYSSGSILDLFHNPRLTLQWQPSETYAEILVPLTANNGVGSQCAAVGGGAGNHATTFEWAE